MRIHQGQNGGVDAPQTQRHPGHSPGHRVVARVTTNTTPTDDDEERSRSANREPGIVCSVGRSSYQDGELGFVDRKYGLSFCSMIMPQRVYISLVSGYYSGVSSIRLVDSDYVTLSRPPC